MVKNNTLFNKSILLPLLFVFNTSILSAKTDITYTQIDENTKKIDVKLQLEKGDSVYKDNIEVAADHPQVQLSEWKINRIPTTRFSKDFREAKQVYDRDFTLTFEATKAPEQDVKNAHIHVSYYLESKKGIVEETIPFEEAELHGEIEDVVTNIDTLILVEEANESKKNKKKEKKSWTQYLQNLVKTTKSPWVQIIIALLLGILLSLTPCIYPMVPITVGILQAQGSKSVLHNFLLSLLYVMGIAVTFASLGLIAAFTGQVFGSILSNPIFVTIVVIFLAYLALSMLGFYEMYIPRFMQTSTGNSGKKSLLSIFLFGVASGSIASPCVSPGLVLLLSIVTTMGSKLLGFLLLFAFGIGLGVPLIIVGTFSGSIAMMPKAGMWMLEIKKIFGLLLFGVCFYFLQNIMPFSILLWFLAVFLIFIGAFYLYSVAPYDSKFWKLFKNIVGICSIALAVFVGFNAYKETYITKPVQEIVFWEKDFVKALQEAKKENKKLLVDFYTPVCAICKAIDKKVFRDKEVIDTLQEKFISVKVDGSDPSKEPFASLNKTHKIFGFPTFLLLNPDTGKVIKRWSSEFNGMSNKDIIKLFKNL